MCSIRASVPAVFISRMNPARSRVEQLIFGHQVDRVGVAAATALGEFRGHHHVVVGRKPRR